MKYLEMSSALDVILVRTATVTCRLLHCSYSHLNQMTEQRTGLHGGAVSMDTAHMVSMVMLGSSHVSY